MVIKGKVHIFGNDINTDDIIAAQYLDTTDPKELGKHCMEIISSDFVKKVKPGDIVVAGKNFGCGSSREHAPLALKGCGIALVIAQSFARIFFRNAINIGLPILELHQKDMANGGDYIEVDLTAGTIKNITKGTQRSFSHTFPEFMQELINAGGLMQYIQKKRKGDKV